MADIYNILMNKFKDIIDEVWNMDDNDPKILYVKYDIVECISNLESTRLNLAIPLLEYILTKDNGHVLKQMISSYIDQLKSIE